MYILSLLNIFFPFVFIFPIVIIYLFSDLDRNHRNIVFLNVIFSVAFFGFVYHRVGNTGDVYRYAISLASYAHNVQFNGRGVITNLYELNYPIWYLIYYICSIFDLSIKYINMLAGISIYGSIFYIISSLIKIYPYRAIDKSLFIISFLFISIISVYTSYKTIWAFSFTLVGIYQLSVLDKKSGYIFILLGIGIHPVSWIPTIAYFISKKIHIKTSYIGICFLIGLIIKHFSSIFYFFKNIPFIGEKIDFYIFGEWGDYRFQNNSEYVLFYLLIVLVSFLLLSVFFKIYKIDNSSVFLNYNNFIFTFMCISFLLVSYRTFSIRLIVTGVIFYYPFIYQVLIGIKSKKKNLVTLVLLLLLFLFFDPRTFNLSNPSYIIANGFPFNVFYSPLLSAFYLN